MRVCQCEVQCVNTVAMTCIHICAFIRRIDCRLSQPRALRHCRVTAIYDDDTRSLHCASACCLRALVCNSTAIQNSNAAQSAASICSDEYKTVCVPLSVCCQSESRSYAL
jgi:hypothetical protein